MKGRGEGGQRGMGHISQHGFICTAVNQKCDMLVTIIEVVAHMITCSECGACHATEAHASWPMGNVYKGAQLHENMG